MATPRCSAHLRPRPEAPPAPHSWREFALEHWHQACQERAIDPDSIEGAALFGTVLAVVIRVRAAQQPPAAGLPLLNRLAALVEMERTVSETLTAVGEHVATPAPPEPLAIEVA